MRHFIATIYAAVVIAVLLIIVAMTYQAGAHSITALALFAIAYFAWSGYSEARANWPTYVAERERNANAARHAAQQRRCRTHTDIH